LRRPVSLAFAEKLHVGRITKRVPDVGRFIGIPEDDCVEQEETKCPHEERLEGRDCLGDIFECDLQ
jgi:hypothetical protein